MAKNVLVTGFEPFGGEKIDPSEMVARSLEGRLIAGRSCAVRILPVETRTLRERIEEHLAQDDPDLIVALAQFGGRTAMSMERVAVNVLDFDRVDASGVARKGDAIVRGGADARLSNLPFDRVLESWHANGIPGYVSNSAGTFIGNQALYNSSDWSKTRRRRSSSDSFTFPTCPRKLSRPDPIPTPRCRWNS